MSSDIGTFGALEDLYQQVILDHSRDPRNRHEMADPTGRAEGYNPLCGDRVTVFVRLDGDRIADAAFTGQGCAICTASSSMMTQALKGRTVEELSDMFEHFHHMLTGDDEAAEDREALGKLAVFSGVRKYPVRVKCATLAWHTVKAALKPGGAEEIVSTE